MQALRAVHALGLGSWCIGTGAIRGLVWDHLGLHDLFNMVGRRNPTRVAADVYLQRVAQKRFAERWPKVKVLPAENRL